MEGGKIEDGTSMGIGGESDWLCARRKTEKHVWVSSIFWRQGSNLEVKERQMREMPVHVLRMEKGCQKSWRKEHHILGWETLRLRLKHL